MTGKTIRFHTEIVNGICPTCEEYTMLVGITRQYYRCITCGADLEQNSEFRIKYPRGELGQSSGEAELFMLVEHLAGLLEDIDSEVKSMRNNAVNIEFLQERTKKLTEDVEKLIRNGNGHQ